MSEFLFQYYPVHPTTWAYLSSLLMIGLFVKFGRFWSVRNLDLLLLIVLAPGLLLVHFGEEQLQKKPTTASESVATVADTNSLEPLDDSVANLESDQRATLTDVTPEATAGRGTAGDATLVDYQSNNSSADVGEDEGSLSAAAAVDPDVLLGAAPSGVAAADNEPQSQNPEVQGPEVGGSEDEGSDEQAPGGESESIVAGEPLDDGLRLRAFGFVWLLTASGLLLFRLLFDPAMVRRPLLEPNLSTGGLIFIGCSLFLFLMANVVSSTVTETDLKGPRGADRLLAAVADEERAAGASSAIDALGEGESKPPTAEWNGPGNAVMYLVPNLVTMPQLWSDTVERTEDGYTRLAKAMAILSHLAVVIGIVAIGYRHFGNIQTGIGAATLYLMLPYTAQMTGRVDHILPAALLVWAVLCYRRPLPAGMFIGLAIGVAYYPLFLLPLWISFYRQRGLMRFFSGVLSMLLIVGLSMIFVSEDLAAFGLNIRRMFGLRLPEMLNLGGVWGLGWEPMYRIPVLAAFVALSGALAIWPIRKNLGTLLSCSAALMVATQFWHGDGGGLYVAWYVPLALLTIFRPNLEDRVALTVLGAGWLPRRFKSAAKGVDIAA